MKVLFVASGNSKHGMNPVVWNQMRSLTQTGIEIDYFLIVGRGLTGYLKSIVQLKKKLRDSKCDLVHAHYSLSAIAVTLTMTNKPIVASLMGSEAYAKPFSKFLVRFFYIFFWNRTIVKSKEMVQKLKLSNAIIIPNGVDFNRYRPLNRLESCNKVDFNYRKINISFFSDPNRPEKNFALARAVIESIEIDNISFNLVYGKNPEMIPYYLNASDIVLLTSFYEGSPNIIKEALACNKVIVASKVGDIPSLFFDVDGCYLANLDLDDFKSKTEDAINYFLSYGESKGRIKLQKIGLDSNSINKRIINTYNELICENSY